MAKLIAKTYSDALFEVGFEENKLDEFLQELTFVADTFKAYPEFFTIIRSPEINKGEKKEIITEIFRGKLSLEMLNFLKIIIDKNRIFYIEEIKREFERRVNDHKGIIKAVVYTVVPLSDEERGKLKEKLDKITGKNTEIVNKIDKDIVGGVLVRVGDKVIDGTIKARLDELKDSLAQIIV